MTTLTKPFFRNWSFLGSSSLQIVDTGEGEDILEAYLQIDESFVGVGADLGRPTLQIVAAGW